MEYVNRKGERYYIFQGTTKTGKPKFYGSKKAISANGFSVPALPSEFEIAESPRNATVTVRRKQPTKILPEERDLVHRLALELSSCSTVQTVVDHDRIVVYTPDGGEVERQATEWAKIFECSLDKAFGWLTAHADFSAEIRFTLHHFDSDADRTYTLERFCYRSSVDDWIGIAGAAPLERHARAVLPHLGRESFFELY